MQTERTVRTRLVEDRMVYYGHELYANDEYVAALWEKAESELTGTGDRYSTSEIADRVAISIIALAYGKRAVIEAMGRDCLASAFAQTRVR
jgi:hypothetical protein